MKVQFFDLKGQYQSIRPELDTAIQLVIDQGNFVGGKVVADFESAFATQIGAPHCIGVGNGTDALFVGLKTLGVSSGDEIITPALSWISSAETISSALGKPVFVDVLPDTATIDPHEVKAKINSRTRGVVAVHLFGQAANVHELRDICHQHSLFLLEDCAQAHLTKENDVVVGNVGDFGAFSFYPTKNLGAYGDAGCLVTSDENLAKEARLFANHGGMGIHEREGINSRLDAIQAAILLAKGKHLSEWNRQRAAHATLYDSLLEDVKEVRLPKIRRHTVATYHQYVIRTASRDDLIKFLSAREIETKIHYPKALIDLPAYRNLHVGASEFPIARQWAQSGLSLPIYPELTEEQIKFVGHSIREYFSSRKR